MGGFPFPSGAPPPSWGSPPPGIPPAATCEGQRAAGQPVVPVGPRDGVLDGAAHGSLLDAGPAPRLLGHHLAQHVPEGAAGYRGGPAGPEPEPSPAPSASPVLEANHAAAGPTWRPANGRSASARRDQSSPRGGGDRGRTSRPDASPAALPFPPGAGCAHAPCVSPPPNPFGATPPPSRQPPRGGARGARCLEGTLRGP